MKQKRVIAVDLDGTLAFYTEWKGLEDIGAPIPLMVQKVKNELAKGTEVRIFTARVSSGPDRTKVEIDKGEKLIKDWCEKHIGKRLPVTCVKEWDILEIWDDRARGVKKNTGKFLEKESE